MYLTLYTRLSSINFISDACAQEIKFYSLWKNFYKDKSHISVGIAIKALLKGHSVLFTPVSEMLSVLHQSKADNSYYRKLDYYIKPELLVLDELGFKKIPGYSADDFFEVISKRYEKGSVIITTNKNFEEWGDIFSDNILASAIIDRVVHHSTVLKVNGDSYRSKDIKKERGKKM